MNKSEKEKIAGKLLLIAKRLLNNQDKNEYMIYGYKEVNNAFRITLLIEMKCFMENYGYDEIKKACKETRSLFMKIERIANKLHCKKIGYTQKGTMNIGIFEAENEDVASDFIDEISKVKPKFIVNKLK